MRSDVRVIVLAMVFALLACAGCAGQDTPRQAVTPSPTIAGAALQQSPRQPGTATGARATATRPPSPSRPAPTPTAGIAIAPGATAVPASFSYLWPAYLPPGMQVSPAESRVAREGEVGEGGIGFFIVTFASGSRKLVVGGGATETLPLVGDERHISVGSRQATLTTSGDQRQIVFDVSPGRLFVYGFGIDEADLLRVAGSLEPIDVRDMRARVGAS